jgi:hypothetical protein
MLRKLIIICLTVVSSIIVWETIDFEKHTVLARPIAPKIQSGPSAPDNLSLRYEEKTQLTVGQRLVVLALFILLAPVITAPLANRILDKQSNIANLLLLFGYTGLDILAAYMVGAASIGGIWSTIVHLVALLAVFSYNLWICAFLARLRQH